MPALRTKPNQTKPTQTSLRLGTGWMNGDQLKTALASQPPARQLAAIQFWLCQCCAPPCIVACCRERNVIILSILSSPFPTGRQVFRQSLLFCCKIRAVTRTWTFTQIETSPKHRHLKGLSYQKSSWKWYGYRSTVVGKWDDGLVKLFKLSHSFLMGLWSSNTTHFKHLVIILKENQYKC